MNVRMHSPPDQSEETAIAQIHESTRPDILCFGWGCNGVDRTRPVHLNVLILEGFPIITGRDLEQSQIRGHPVDVYDEKPSKSCR